MTKRVVAVMQPYWLPYAGYYRLLAAADLFVVLDCVQFPRRGYVHRNQFVGSNGNPDWVTLPLEKAPREATIAEMKFRSDADEAVSGQLGRFPSLSTGNPAFSAIESAFTNLKGSLSDKLVEQLVYFRDELRLECEVLRSTELGELSGRGQQLILEIVRRVDGERYVNPSGGKDLYDFDKFSSAGVELSFLPSYEGSYLSIGQEILDGKSFAEIRDDLMSQISLEFE